ncbi:MAG: bifunctional phosphoribosylaminoimidazolecarboxamide formyltransferase/IMP cyclohydrolase, partial [Spirochaetota bacterium]
YDREKDNLEAEKLGIKPIDMVICNLYPFKEVMEKGAGLDRLVDNIDIGGPTMIRAAAKNFKYVTVLTDINDYKLILEELNRNDGGLTYETRKKLMSKAFNHTADYDSVIAMTMDKENGENSLRLSFKGGKGLRYGENSHQDGYFYKESRNEASIYDMKTLSGKELSFNNIMDINSAVESVKRLKNTACAVIKHSNPCGLCEGNEQRTVFEYAWNGDPVSAFGSIIAFNRRLEKSTAQFLNLDSKDKSKKKFVEVIIAPEYTEDAIEYLKQHKNLRIIKFDINKATSKKDIKYINNAILVQNTDNKLYSSLEKVTQNTYDVDKNKNLIEFGIKAVINIKSNSIVVVREKDGFYQLLGMGAGQPNRLISTKLALDKCGENLANEFEGDKEELEKYIKEELGKSILISDAFFPFPDNIELAYEYGIKTIIQPGGSIRDKSVIKACDEHGMNMIFTGIRHFKH